jgi:hypothetical protein
MINHVKSFALPCAVMAALLSGQAKALELEPEEFVTAPAGTTALLGYAIYSHHDKLVPVSGPALDDGTSLDLKLGIARLAHYFDIGGTLALVEVLQPFGSLANAQINGRKLKASSGLGDTIVAAAVWPINDKDKQTYFGVTLYVTAPTGKYEKTAPINLGGNRFVYNPQIALSQGLGKRWSFDLTADLLLYGKNREAGAGGTQRLSQSNSVQMQAFLNHKWSNGINTSIGYQGLRGGKQRLDGVDNGTRTRFDEVRFVASKFVAPKFQLMGEVNRQFNVRGGFRQDVGLLIRALYVL